MPRFELGRLADNHEPYHCALPSAPLNKKGKHFWSKRGAKVDATNTCFLFCLLVVWYFESSIQMNISNDWMDYDGPVLLSLSFCKKWPTRWLVDFNPENRCLCKCSCKILPLPLQLIFLLTGLLASHFRTNWLSWLGHGNQVGSSTDHLPKDNLPSSLKDWSTTRAERGKLYSWESAPQSYGRRLSPKKLLHHFS